MQIDDGLISNLEDLSCFTLSTEEKKQMKEDLQSIVNGISLISGLNTDGVPEAPFNKVNVFRNDEVQPSLERTLILKNAPVKNDEYFITPKVIE